MKQALDFRESLRIALRAIRANKGRGALTTLGIIIGIVAVVVTMTAANGLRNKFRESFSAVGTDVILYSRAFAGFWSVSTTSTSSCAETCR